MCYSLRKEVRRWCGSFTSIELCLCLLEVILLAAVIGTLTFLTIHLLVCAQDITESYNENESQNITVIKRGTTEEPTSSIFTLTSKKPTLSTLPSNVECTWEPSKKTKPTTHYYFYKSAKYPATAKTDESSTKQILDSTNKDEFTFDDMNSDGNDAAAKYKDCIAALVKMKPPADVTFGCILTKINLYWTLTAASCIESVEEVDSLDSFFIMDGLGEIAPGRNHALADVQIHPLYQGANRSFDLAALRSEDALASNTAHLTLPTMVEYFLVAVGERFTILGYGRYRTIEAGAAGRRLRHVHAYTVSTWQCGAEAEGEVWAPRHLSRGGALAAGACGAGGALCAGALAGRGAPCSYCAGTPLVRAGRLFGVMSDNRQCGVACDPQLYVNVAALSDWIRSLLI